MCLRDFPLHVQNRNNMEEISWTHSREETGGLQSLKISCAADRHAGLGRGNSASIPLISAIPAAFSTISKVLPYKLKTTEAVPDKMEKEKSSRLPRGSCFPSTRDVSAEASGPFLFFFFAGWTRKSWGSRGCRVAVSRPLSVAIDPEPRPTERKSSSHSNRVFLFIVNCLESAASEPFVDAARCQNAAEAAPRRDQPSAE